MSESEESESAVQVRFCASETASVLSFWQGEVRGCGLCLFWREVRGFGLSSLGEVRGCGLSSWGEEEVKGFGLSSSGEERESDPFSSGEAKESAVMMTMTTERAICASEKTKVLSLILLSCN